MYIKSDGFLNRFDTRAKLSAAFLLALSALTVPWGPGIIAVFFILIIAIIAMHIPLVRLAAPIILLGWMFVFTIIIHGFTTSGHILWEIPKTELMLTKEGLIKGIIISSRVMMATVILGIIVLTTDTFETIQALESMARPLRKIGINLRSTALALALALRFVPTLYNEAIILKKALKARGWNSRRKGLKKVTAWLPMIIPLLVNGLRRSDYLADTLVIRRYNPDTPGTSMNLSKWEKGETMLVIISLLPFAAWLI
ncbi:MAG: energy-coupling factor transporter transmembrane component T [Candidatus Electryonea clarkiae]|nr:energy-coupling factor transporter transmembrane component T [Candidatus Electryonea clarkiae]MDP8286340.1 energy-coupling factor transporter transmembrane component T [Candidatus Electryonea clarkiae]